MHNRHTEASTPEAAATAGAVGVVCPDADRLIAAELAAVQAAYLAEACTLADLRAKLLLFLKFERDHLDPGQVEAVEAVLGDVVRIANAAGE